MCAKPSPQSTTVPNKFPQTTGNRLKQYLESVERRLQAIERDNSKILSGQQLLRDIFKGIGKNGSYTQGKRVDKILDDILDYVENKPKPVSQREVPVDLISELIKRGR